VTSKVGPFLDRGSHTGLSLLTSLRFSGLNEGATVIDLRANLPVRDEDRIGVAKMTRHTPRELVTPGALLRAGTTLEWEWVRVEEVINDEVLFTRVMSAAPRS
jgi:hypothetical protein